MVPRTRSRATSLLALVSVLFLLATACSDDSDDGGGEGSATTTTAAEGAEGGGDSATTTTAAPSEEPPSESAAANLRADLVGLLEEQVYLTGYVVVEAQAGPAGLESRVASAAVTTAGESATELSEVIGAGYGVAPGTEFLAAWNDHREAVVAYAVEGGPEGAIDTTRSGIVDVLAEIDPDADFSAVEDGLEASDASLVRTVDELVEDAPGAAADLREAAAPMGEVALSLAEGITGRIETEGELDSPEADLRADLTALLQESALLTGLGLAETVQADGDSSAPGPAGVLEAVEENTDALAELLDLGDESATEEFADLWNGHVDAFERYATALVENDAQGIQTSQDALEQFRDDVGRLLAEAHPGFTQEQVAEELVDHTDTLLAFVDASVREEGDLADEVEETGQLEDAPSEAPGLLREAARVARLAARTLSGGLTAPVATESAE